MKKIVKWRLITVGFLYTFSFKKAGDHPVYTWWSNDIASKICNLQSRNSILFVSIKATTPMGVRIFSKSYLPWGMWLWRHQTTPWVHEGGILQKHFQPATVLIMLTSISMVVKPNYKGSYGGSICLRTSYTNRLPRVLTGSKTYHVRFRHIAKSPPS